MATIKDVARAVGVSSTTISNAVHGRVSRVSDDMLVQIHNTIRDMGYVPNMSARSLVYRSSKVVGFICSVKPGETSETFNSALLSTVEESLRHEGYYLMLRTVSSSSELMSFLGSWNVDGLFLTGSFSPEFREKLGTLRIPAVMIDSGTDIPGISSVDFDDFSGGYMATRHLIQSGHKRIAFASPRRDKNTVMDFRYHGYQTALHDADIPFESGYISEHENACSPLAAGADIGRILTTHKDITAVFAAADVTAAGIVNYLRDTGRRVPDDVSVVGLEGTALSYLPCPPPTTVRRDVFSMGAAAADCLLDQLSGCCTEKRKCVLPPSLVERCTVKTITI